MYTKMLFGLMNAGATFQSEMDISFIDERDNCFLIYLYDLTVFLNSDAEHLVHFKQTFEKCKKKWFVSKP